MGPEQAIVDDALQDQLTGASTTKLRALLQIADKVRQYLPVTDEDVGLARKAAADDQAIHDTVLIAAAFSMFNRYVDGLATWAPIERQNYLDAGERLATQGYVRP